MKDWIDKWYYSPVWGLLGFFLMVSPFLGTLVYCIDKVLKGEALEPFRLGNVPIPKFLGAGASYLDVLFLDIAILIALVIGLIWRYCELHQERDFKEKYGLRDGNRGHKNSKP